VLIQKQSDEGLKDLTTVVVRTVVRRIEEQEEE
jgi:hypothetical protein